MKEVKENDGVIVYSLADKLARENNQVVGEKNDYYITLEQLMNIVAELD